MKLIAHQGTRIFGPENSIPAFVKAAGMGFYAINFAQVRASKEATLYVMHDDTVDRTTDGTGAIAEMGDEQIAGLSIDLRASYAEYELSDFSREELHVPTLEEGLSICREYGCIPMIRMGILPEGNGRAFENLGRLIEEFNLHPEGTSSSERFLLSGPVETMFHLDSFYPDVRKIVYSGRMDAAEMIELFNGYRWKDRHTVYAMLQASRMTREAILQLASAGYGSYAANPNDYEHPEEAMKRYRELEADGCEYANAERFIAVQ